MRAVLKKASCTRASGQELMVKDMKDITCTGKEMEKEFCHGQTVNAIKVYSAPTNSKVKVFKLGLTVDGTKEILKMIRWRAKVSLLGQMVDGMKENLKRIRWMQGIQARVS